ncbi:M20/M25/M40 family metallo-hydrolase [Streptomonospora wellingtoniae]|uniref:M20/M25/M40 family metallo-hydrolase n=1 Tax=Streptomonospora wellingtoniae TaxID=3075544 RepID=A0ABU2KR35_9ACTN|nr:M20/M25/M40 family metallo-hydrolase [Streptomonospora sp. DSM 45055]MDT0301734.1 M20/M25/M40 family metallo-hydrolase [Streptomonospora sp. DSM 45055]
MPTSPTGRSPRPRRHVPPTVKRLASAGASATLVLGLGLAPGTAHADEAVLPTLVTPDGLREHVENLSTIADYNGGNRATNTPGYDVAADYVTDQLKRAGYRPRRDTYDYELWEEHSEAVLTQLAPEKREFTPGEDFVTMTYSGAGDATGAGVPVDYDSTDSGCTAEDFAGFPEGAIAIVMRGSCSFQAKTANAAEAGAAGTVVANNVEGPLNGTVSEESAIPVVGTTTATGDALVAAGDSLELRLKVDASVSERTSYNIVAETKGGARDNVVMVGAHLDSVPEGPGINDNGSGTAAILETAQQLAKLDGHENKVRFAFWGTEEQGLVGSTKYVEGLNERQRERIALYLNFDMLGSPNFGRFIYDGRGELEGSLPPPSGSGAIQKMFEDYYEQRGLVTEPTAFSGRSDYSAFMEAGIASGGLFSGGDAAKTEQQVEYYGGTAGEDFDPNYHTAQDDIGNIDWTALDQLSDGVAYAVETYSKSTLPVNGVAPRIQSAQEFRADRVGDLWLR